MRASQCDAVEALLWIITGEDPNGDKGRTRRDAGRGGHASSFPALEIRSC